MVGNHPYNDVFTVLAQVNFAKFIEHQKLSMEYMKQVPQSYYCLTFPGSNKSEQAETFVSDLREEMDRIRNSSDFVRFTIILQ